MRIKWKASNQRHIEESVVKMEMHTDVEGEVSTARKRRYNDKAQKQLLEALRNDDFAIFIVLLKKDVDVDHKYENQRTLLIEACWKTGGEKFVKELLTADADPNLADNEKVTALHAAAFERNDKCMQLLLEHPRTIAHVLDDQEFSPLHCATLAFWDNAHARAHGRCIQMLMERLDLEVNRPDKFGDSAVWNALQHPDADAEQILKVMLKCANGRLNVDVWHVRNGSTIRKVIETKFPKLKHLLPELSENITGLDPIMGMLLQPNPDLEMFRTVLPKDIDRWYGEPYHCTCLELACRRKDLQGFVKVLLDAKADPNQRNKIYDIPLLHQAMANANYDALNAMKSCNNVNFRITNSCNHTVLHIAAHRQCTTREEELEIQKCVNLVLGQKDEATKAEQDDDEVGPCACARPRVNINAQDASGDTALHDAVHYGRQHVALPLLRSGASLLVRNHAKYMPLHSIDCGTLRLFLDEQIRGSGQPRSENYKITVRYNFLDPQEKSITEIDTVYHISRSYHLRELLQHPVIRSFLDLKWHLTRWFFYITLLVYIIFIILFTTYVLVINEEHRHSNCTKLPKEEFEGNFPESKLNENISVISSKCENFTNYCFRNSTHLCIIDVDARTDMSMLFVRILCICFLAVLSLIEILQFGTGPRRYVTDSENLIEILTIIVCACALSCDFNTSKLRQHISAISILTSWLGLVLLSGRMPLLSIQLEVLKKVSFTFLRFMAWYSLLVIAFVLSFYILFRQREEEEKPFFHTPGMTILRTIAMMIGELEASSLKFDQVHITSHAIFLVFVFLIIVILMNVLSGLAVSDTQSIIDDAKVQRLVSLVKLISYFERMIIVTQRCFRKVFCQKYIQPMIMVFPSNAHDKQINLDKTGHVTFFRPQKESKSRFEDNFTVEQDIVASAMKVLSDKNQAPDMDQMMRLLNILREEIGKYQGEDLGVK